MRVVEHIRLLLSPSEKRDGTFLCLTGVEGDEKGKLVHSRYVYPFGTVDSDGDAHTYLTFSDCGFNDHLVKFLYWNSQP